MPDLNPQPVQAAPHKKWGGFVPKRFEIVVFSFFLSLFMSLLVSGISTARTLGLTDLFVAAWPGTFLSSWLVAFPAVLVVAPLVRRLVARLVKA